MTVYPQSVIVYPQARASPKCMGQTSFGLDIGIFCDFLYSVLLLDVSLGLDFLGLALSRPQVPHPDQRGGRPAAGDASGCYDIKATMGLGRVVALYLRSSTIYQICDLIR